MKFKCALNKTYVYEVYMNTYIHTYSPNHRSTNSLALEALVIITFLKWKRLTNYNSFLKLGSHSGSKMSIFTHNNKKQKNNKETSNYSAEYK